MLEKNPKIPIFKKLVFNIIYDFLKQKNRLNTGQWPSG